MAQNFGKARNCELSVVFGIDTALSALWDNVTVVKGFPQSNASSSLPIVSVRLLTDTANFREIGSRALNDVYSFAIDIFAKSDGQRLDLAQSIRDILLNDFTYYVHSHNSGDPETLTKVDSGRVVFTQFTDNSKVDFAEDVELFDKFRHFIGFDCRIALSS
jgi:hypothetical protein